MNSICSITPTICRLLGIPRPAACRAEPLREVTETAGGSQAGPSTRCLIFSPDAVGSVLVGKHASLFLPVRIRAPIEVPLRSVIPPKTPVCYASMFTGAPPEVHGIEEYVMRAPACETVFDVLTRTGHSTAIVAVKGSTMDTIFRSTGADQFTEACDEAVLRRTISLIERDRHQVIVAYQQQYDDILHRGHPESAEALDAVRAHVDSFHALAAAAGAAWGSHRYLVAFSPDHGAHFDRSLGAGAHGDDTPDDMHVTHFFGLGLPKCLPRLPPSGSRRPAPASKPEPPCSDPFFGGTGTSRCVEGMLPPLPFAGLHGFGGCHRARFADMLHGVGPAYMPYMDGEGPVRLEWKRRTS
jgi:hypothetical protein